MGYDDIDQYMIYNNLNGKLLAEKPRISARFLAAAHINADNPGEELAFWPL